MGDGRRADGDVGLDGLFVSLEAGYDALVTREEDVAAADLALSLIQDRSLARALVRSGPLDLVRDGGRAPIVQVGPDHVVLGDAWATHVPFAAGVVAVAGCGVPPEPSDRALVQVMRAAVRDRAGAVVGLDGACERGRLLAAAPDHLILLGRAGRLLIGIAALRWIRIVDRGTADVS